MQSANDINVNDFVMCKYTKQIYYICRIHKENENRNVHGVEIGVSRAGGDLFDRNYTFRQFKQRFLLLTKTAAVLYGTK